MVVTGEGGELVPGGAGGIGSGVREGIEGIDDDEFDLRMLGEESGEIVEEVGREGAVIEVEVEVGRKGAVVEHGGGALGEAGQAIGEIEGEDAVRKVVKEAEDAVAE